MPAKRFNEADIDFDAIDGELAKLVPPKLSLTDVLDRLRKRLVEQQAKGVTVAQMHEVLKSGASISRSAVCGHFWTRACCREGRLPKPRELWCRKKAVIRFNQDEGAYGSAKRRSDVQRTAVRHCGFRGVNNEQRGMKLQAGDGRAMAWRVSARVRRWREAPCRDRSKNGEPRASIG